LSQIIAGCDLIDDANDRCSTAVSMNTIKRSPDVQNENWVIAIARRRQARPLEDD